MKVCGTQVGDKLILGVSGESWLFSWVERHWLALCFCVPCWMWSYKRKVCAWNVYKCERLQIQIDLILKTNFKQLIWPQLISSVTLKDAPHTKWYSTSVDTLHRKFWFWQKLRRHFHLVSCPLPMDSERAPQGIQLELIDWTSACLHLSGEVQFSETRCFLFH